MTPDETNAWIATCFDRYLARPPDESNMGPWIDLVNSQGAFRLAQILAGSAEGQLRAAQRLALLDGRPAGSGASLTGPLPAGIPAVVHPDHAVITPAIQAALSQALGALESKAEAGRPPAVVALIRSAFLAVGAAGATFIGSLSVSSDLRAAVVAAGLAALATVTGRGGIEGAYDTRRVAA